MNREILVNHQEVYNMCAALRASIESEIVAESQRGYASINDQLQQVDGATNAVLIDVVDYNLEKTLVCGRTLTRLLGLIESATRELEAEDAQMAQDVNQGQEVGSDG